MAKVLIRIGLLVLGSLEVLAGQAAAPRFLLSDVDRLVTKPLQSSQAQSSALTADYSLAQAALPRLTARAERWRNPAQLIELISLQQRLSHVSSRPGKPQLASAGYASHVTVWDIQTGQVLRYIGPANPPEDHLQQAAAVSALQYSDDGNWLLTATANGSIALWDAESAELQWRIPGAEEEAVAGSSEARSKYHSGAVNALVFAPQSLFTAAEPRWFASAGEDGALHIRRLADGALLKRIQLQRSWLTALAISADGAWLFAASENGALQAFAVAGLDQQSETQWRRFVLPGHSSYIYDLAISADSSWLASAAHQQAVQLWPLSSLQQFAAQQASEVSQPMVVPLKPFSLQQASMDIGPQAEAISVAFSADSQWLYSGHADSSIMQWSVASQQLVQQQQLGSSDVVDLALAVGLGTDSGQHSGSTQLIAGHWQGEISVIDAADLVTHRRLIPQRTALTAMTVNAAADWLLAADQRGNLSIWDLTQQQLRYRFATAEKPIKQLALAANELSFAALSDDGHIWLHIDAAANYCQLPSYSAYSRVQERQLLPQLRKLELGLPATAIAYSADSKHLLAAIDNAVYFLPLTALARGQIAASDIMASGQNQPTASQISNALAANLQVLQAADQPIEKLAVSADGMWVAAALQDHRVLLWKLATMQPPQIEQPAFIKKPAKRLEFSQQWQLHRDEITLLEFVANEQLVAIDNSGTVLQWQLADTASATEQQLLHSVDAAAINAEHSQLLVISNGLQPQAEAQLRLYSWPSLELQQQLAQQDNQVALQPRLAGQWLMSSLRGPITQLSEQSAKLQHSAVLLAGQNGQWLSCQQLQQTPVCWRGDAGGFLKTVAANGRLSWLKPLQGSAH